MRARTSVPLVVGLASWKETEVDSGSVTPTPFASYDHDSSSWKTSVLSLFEASTLFSDRWPSSGSMRNGGCFQRQPLAPAIAANGCSSSPGLPTPTAGDATGGHHVTNLRWDGGTAYRPSGAKASVSLREALDLLPTPVANDSGNTPEDHLRKKPGREVVTSLAIIVENDLLPSGGRMPLPSPDGDGS